MSQADQNTSLLEQLLSTLDLLALIGRETDRDILVRKVLEGIRQVMNVEGSSVWEVNREDGSDFTKQDVIIFEAFAGQVAVALDHAKLYDMAVFDGLTRIHNRTFFIAWADTEFARALRMSTPLSITLFDIDFFKKFNDTFGHEAGDVVLKTVANLVENNVRKSDV